jgi:ABC-type uncharacterized transport system auxiliary subunit
VKRKIIINVFMILALALVFVGCKKKNNNNTNLITKIIRNMNR